MPLGRDMLLLGVSHRTAPVELRERCVVPLEGLGERLQELRSVGGLDECWVLSTCNRTEVLAVAPSAAGVDRYLRSALFGSFPSREESLLYQHHGVDAVFHVFRVAAGLDSQVLGESQILAQIKGAAGAAREAGTLGAMLAPLLDQALAVGKRVRSETRVGEGTLSVARAAVELAQKVLGELSTIRGLIVGAGETGMLVARHLVEAGVRRLAFANRSLERGRRSAAALGAESIGLEGLREALSEANLTVVAVEAASPVVRMEHLDHARLRKHDRPPLIIDISVPRGVAEELKRQRGLLVHDVDDLESIVARHRQGREAEVAAAGRILVEEVHKFFALRTYASFKPVITGLVARFEEIRQEVLAQSGPPDDLDAVTRYLSRRLLDEALVRMKEGARHTLSPEHLDRRYRNYLERS